MTLHVKAAPPTSRDPAGAFRFASGIVALAGVGGTLGAILEPMLGRRRRAAAAIGAAAIALVAMRGARQPRLAARAFLEHPTATLVGGVTPVLASPVLGRRFTSLHMLTVTGVGVAAAVLPKKRHGRLAAGSAVYWLAQIAIQSRGEVRELLADDKFTMTVFTVPLAFWAVAHITPDVLTAARELGQLQDKLDAAKKQEAALVAYRAALERAFPVVRRALELTRQGIESMPDAQARAEALNWLHRVAGRLEERAAVLDASTGGRDGRSNVERLLRKRAEALARLELDPPDISVVAQVPRVTDARTLALIGSTTASGLSNSLRHSVGASMISVTASFASGRVKVMVEDDGEPADPSARRSFGSSGLGSLRDQAHALDGDLVWGPREGGGWIQQLELPIDPPVGPISDLIAERMTKLVDAALAAATRACGLMVVAMAVEGRQLIPGSSARSRALAIGVPLAYEVLDRRRLLSRWGTRFLAAAAFASAVSLHREHSVWPGWPKPRFHAMGCAAATRH